MLFRSDAAQQRYLEQRELIHELVELLLENGDRYLQPTFHESWERAGSATNQLRVVIDQVASLTDVGARTLWASMKGTR